MMWMVIIILVLLAVMTGFNKCEGYSLAMDVNTLKTPYFALGIHYRQHIVFGEEIAELTIGLVLVNLVMTFYKEKHVE